MAKGWKRAFEDPIPLPDGRSLVTLRDAGNYITKLPKAEHTAPVNPPAWNRRCRFLLTALNQLDAQENRRRSQATRSGAR
jgi:hypothetical protein